MTNTLSSGVCSFVSSLSLICSFGCCISCTLKLVKDLNQVQLLFLARILHRCLYAVCCLMKGVTQCLIVPFLVILKLMSGFRWWQHDQTIVKLFINFSSHGIAIVDCDLYYSIRGYKIVLVLPFLPYLLAGITL